MFDYGGGRKTFCCLNGKITQIAETHWSMSVTMRVAYHNMKRNRFDWVNCRRSKCNIWFSTDFGWAMYLFKLWYEMSPHIWEFTYHARLKTKKGRTVNFKLATRQWTTLSQKWVCCNESYFSYWLNHLFCECIHWVACYWLHRNENVVIWTCPGIVKWMQPLTTWAVKDMQSLGLPGKS